MPPAEITVVVCTYNRANMLRDTLDSLCRLETNDEFLYEILVVDNASSDNTPAVIDEVSVRSPVPIRGVFEPNAGVSFARNRGIAQARTPWIAFFDDDQIAHAAWLKELRAAARTKDVRCVGGANRLRLPDGQELPPISRAARSLLSETVEERPRPYSRKWAPGTGNLMVERSVFLDVGVFDISLREGGEDTDLFRRIYNAKIQAWFTPDAISYHVIPAYRLSDPYLRWKALRNGGQLARGSFVASGSAGLCAATTARLVQAFLAHVPRLTWAKLTGNALRAHHFKCLLWRAEGYCRHALHFLAPRIFTQTRFFHWLEFRSEQQMFCATGNPN